MRAILLMIVAALWMSPAFAEWSRESGDVESIASDAGNTIKDEYAQNDVTPRMRFQCAPGDPSVTARIDWGRFISSFSTEVGFKVDDGRFMWLKWKVDGSEKVTLSPSADDTRRLLDAIEGGSLLTVDVSPYSEGPVVVTFDLAGFAEALAALGSSC
jgi:hypothetical protein